MEKLNNFIIALVFVLVACISIIVLSNVPEDTNTFTVTNTTNTTIETPTQTPTAFPTPVSTEGLTYVYIQPIPRK